MICACWRRRCTGDLMKRVSPWLILSDVPEDRDIITVVISSCKIALKLRVDSLCLKCCTFARANAPDITYVVRIREFDIHKIIFVKLYA